MSRTGAVRYTVRKTPNALADFIDIVLRLGTRKCLEPRDRIFGLLSLVHWPHGTSPLRADYTMSATDIALKALPFANQSPLAVALQLIDLLDIMPHDAQMQAMAKRRVLESPHSQSTLLQPLPDHFSTSLISQRCTKYLHINCFPDLDEEFPPNTPHWRLLSLQPNGVWTAFASVLVP